ncbi:MAG: choice-of-anchor D domain-containing protein [Bacteroidetes bacterium]|nr:choice-of-anchor D domain-containing protein [Bacteroidota bacterium]
MKTYRFLFLFAVLAVHLLTIQHAAAQWQWLNPLSEGNEFLDATFPDAQHGWIAGGNGALLRTSDGGMTWSSQPNILRTTPFLGLSIVFTDALTGVVSTNNGLLLRSSDGGFTWELLPRTSLTIQKLRKAPDGSLWGVGSLGTVARSTDAGLSWERLSTGISTVVYDIDFPDAQTVVAVCGGGVILRSVDSGQSWTSIAASIGTDITSIDFRDAQNGFAVQKPKYLLRTTDGGATWSDTSFVLNELTQVRFTSPTTGWLVSNSVGSVFKTIDGGSSWQFVAVEQPRRFTFYSVYPVDEQKAFLLGTGGAIFSTLDGGQSWTQHGTAFSRQHFHGVSALSDSSAWVFGDGAAFFTDNAGQSWSGSDTISLAGFRSGYALSDTRIIGAGSQGQVMFSDDAGQNWTTQQLNGQGQIAQIVFVDDNNGWLAGAHGTLARSSDGGATWIDLDAGVTHDFNGIAAISASEAWVVGNEGRIYHTSDGGANWIEQNSTVSTHLQTVYFTDAMNGWAGGQLALLKTSDGGTTWISVPGLAGLDVIYRIVFTDAQHGYFMLSRSVARTSDGGTTFYRTDYPAVGLRDLDAVGDGHLWLAGDFGTVLRYTPAAAIYIQPSRLDFGDVAVNRQQDLSFTVFNRGEIPLDFTNVATIGTGFLFANGDLSPLPPGDSRVITVAFAPKDTGMAYGTATVYSNAALGIPFIDLVGHGVPPGTSALTHAPDTLDFGTLLLGTYESRYVRVTNRGTQPILVNVERMSGGDSTMFQVTLESTFFFAAGKVDSVQVTFSPLRPGDFSSWLLIESNDPVEPSYRIPIKGSGITPTIATDDVIEFGYVLIDSSKTMDVSIRNVGRAALHISGWTPGGADASAFAFTNPGAVTIAGGDSLVLPVTFTPRSYGEKSAVITIGSDDLVNSSYDLRLHGNATTLGVDDAPNARAVQLAQNYPNPVSLVSTGQTVYTVTLPSAMLVTLALFDLQGREVLRIAEGLFSAGRHEIMAQLAALPSGSYLAILTAGNAPTQQQQVTTIIVR